MGELSDMSFWKLKVPPGGKKAKVEIEQTAELSQYVHITNAAVAHNAENKIHGLAIVIDQEEIPLASLHPQTHPQHHLDFILDQTVYFVNHGPSPVHLVGYVTTADMSDMQGGSDDDYMESDESEEEEESEDDDEPPALVPVANGQGPKRIAPTKIGSVSKGKAMKQEESDEDDEDEDDEDYEGEEDESDDEEGEGADGLRAALLRAIKRGERDVIMENADDDDDDEGEEEEGEDDEGEDDEGEDDEGESGEGDSESEEEEEPRAKPPQGKRPLASPAALATPAAKKSKAMDGAAVAKPPQSAPPKVQATAGGKPSDEKAYEAAIVAFLKAKDKHTCPLSALGSAVHRPAGVPKLGHFIKSRPNLFQMDKTGANVSLKQ